MPLTAIVNLAERLLNSASRQSRDTSSAAKQSKQAARLDSDARAGDRFIPPAATQQDARLLQALRNRRA